MVVLGKRDLRSKALTFFRVFMVLMCGVPAFPTQGWAINDLERTWVHALVAMPSEKARESHYFRMDTDKGRKILGNYRGEKLPVLVYLHGCTGFSKRDRKFIRKIAERGFLVIAPDSMARAYRPRQCDPDSKRGGLSPWVFDFRQAEINYAVDQLWEKPWADWNNLFLMGVSEGGAATALYRGDFFRARIITQWTCQGAPLIRGLEAQPDVPVLAIVQRNDPWYQNKRTDQRGDCGAYFGIRSGSKSIILEDGKKHNVLKSAGVFEEVMEFLRENIGGSRR